jgi:hypothetical protein
VTAYVPPASTLPQEAKQERSFPPDYARNHQKRQGLTGKISTLFRQISFGTGSRGKQQVQPLPWPTTSVSSRGLKVNEFHSSNQDDDSGRLVRTHFPEPSRGSRVSHVFYPRASPTAREFRARADAPAVRSIPRSTSSRSKSTDREDEGDCTHQSESQPRSGR